MSYQFKEYFPNDFIHLLLAAYSADETGSIGGKCPLKKNQKVCFKQETEIYKFMKSQYQVDLNQYLQNWTVYEIMDDEETGYLGLILENEINRQLVLSHRSTNFALSFQQNMLKQSGAQCDVMSVVICTFTGHQALAFQATKIAVERAQEKQYSLSFCGHSLGAWLSELSIYYCHSEFDPSYENVKAVTFDGPGTWEMMQLMSDSHIKGQGQRFYPEQFDITFYLSAPNIVNCMNSHIGIGYRLYPEEIPLSEFSDKIQKIFETLGVSKNFLNGLSAVWGHDLKFILPYFDPNTGKPKLQYYSKINKWPKIKYHDSGIQNLKGLSKIILDQFIPKFIQKGIKQIFQKVLPSITTITACSISILIFEIIKGNIDQKQFWSVHQFLQRTQQYKPQLNDSNDFNLQMKGAYQTTIPNDFQRDLQKNGSNDFIDQYLINIKNNSHKIGQSFCSQDLKYILNQLVNTYNYSQLKFIQIKNEFQAKLNINILRDQIRILIRDYSNDFQEFLDENPYQDESKIDCYFGRLFNYDAHNAVERKTLTEIEAAFKKSNIVVIIGPRKFGKTTLAYQYAKKLKDQFNIKVWPFNASNQSNLHQDFLFYHKQLYQQQLLTQTQKFTILQTEVLAKIKNIYQDFVIIIDNVENLNMIQSLINETPKHIKIIITAVNCQIFSKSLYQIVNISSMTEQESLNYINKILKNRQLSDDDKKEIINLSNGMPQSLKLLVGQFINNENSLEITQNIKVQAVKQFQQNNNYSPIVEILMDLQDDLAKKILKYISWLYPDKIELDLILQLMKNTECSKDAITTSLRMLADLGLINIQRQHFIQIDDAIQEECIRQELSLQYLSDSLQYFFDILPDIETEKHTDDALKIAQNNHLHARNIINLIIQKQLFQQLEDYFPKLFYYAITIILKLSVIYQYLIQDYQSCQEYLDLFGSLQFGKNIKNSKNLQALSIYVINQIKLLLAMGQKEEALKSNLLDIIIQTGTFNQTPSILADAYYSLGIIYQQNEQYDLSNEYLEKSKIINVDLHGIEDIRIPKLITLQAENFQMQKNYPRAIIFYKQALEQVEKNQMNKSLRETYIVRAKLYYQLGKISFLTNQNAQQSLDYFRQAIKIWKEKLNNQSIEVADFTLNLGLSLKHLKQYSESLEALTTAYEIKSQILKKGQNPQIAQICYEKGLVLIEMSNIQQAEDELKNAQNIMLHSDDFEFKSKIEFQLAYLWKQKKEDFKYIQALGKLIQKTRSYYSFIHPSLNIYLKDLADAYANYFEDYAKQTEIYQQLFFMTILHEILTQTYQKKNLITGLMESKTFQVQDSCKYISWLQNEITHFQIIKKFNQKFFDEEQKRTLILKSGIISKEEFQIKKLLQTSTLNYLREYASVGKWKGGYTGLILYGAKDYITMKYLKNILGDLFNEVQNQKIALMLCFEAINIGIVQSNFQHLDFAQKFMETVLQYPNMNNFLDDVITSHPEYFIDGKILKSLTNHQKYLRENLGIVEKQILLSQSISQQVISKVQGKLKINTEIEQLIKQ